MHARTYLKHESMMNKAPSLINVIPDLLESRLSLFLPLLLLLLLLLTPPPVYAQNNSLDTATAPITIRYHDMKCQVDPNETHIMLYLYSEAYVSDLAISRESLPAWEEYVNQVCILALKGDPSGCHKLFGVVEDCVLPLLRSPTLEDLAHWDLSWRVSTRSPPLPLAQPLSLSLSKATNHPHKHQPQHQQQPLPDMPEERRRSQTLLLVGVVGEGRLESSLLAALSGHTCVGGGKEIFAIVFSRGTEISTEALALLDVILYAAESQVQTKKGTRLN
jgi:hypothetical protein